LRTQCALALAQDGELDRIGSVLAVQSGSGGWELVHLLRKEAGRQGLLSGDRPLPDGAFTALAACTVAILRSSAAKVGSARGALFLSPRSQPPPPHTHTHTMRDQCETEAAIQPEPPPSAAPPKHASGLKSMRAFFGKRPFCAG
jgi:hypothetical protein